MLTQPTPRVLFDLCIMPGNLDIRQSVEAVREADCGGMPGSPARQRPGFAHYVGGGHYRFRPGQRRSVPMTSVASLLQRDQKLSCVRTSLRRAIDDLVDVGDRVVVAPANQPPPTGRHQVLRPPARGQDMLK